MTVVVVPPPGVVPVPLLICVPLGDTSGDKAMLAIADEKGYRVFKSKP